MELFFEIFTVVTGLVYVVLEIKQKNFMWVVGVLTALGAMYMFFSKGLYCSFALNVYYFCISFWGLYCWRRDKRKIKLQAACEDQPEKADLIHLNRLSAKTVIISVLISFVAVFALARLMLLFENPMSYLDSTVAVLSAVATWWLSRAYKQQWIIWIVADALTTTMCLMQGMWWMSVLYAAYTLSAAVGLSYWNKHGVYLSEKEK